MAEMVARYRSHNMLGQSTAFSPQPLDIRTITVSTLQMSKLRFGGKAQAFATNLMTGKNQSPIWVLLTLLDATTCCCLPWLLKDPGGEPSPRTQTWGWLYCGLSVSLLVLKPFLKSPPRGL